MSVQIAFIEPRGPNLDLGDLGKVILVIDAVTEDISKISKGAFQGICGAFLLGLLECRSLPFAVLDVAIADVLVIRAIAESYPDDDGQAEGDFQGLRMLIHEIDLDILDAGGPPVEAEDLVGESYALLGGDVMDFLSRRAAAGGYVFGSQLLFQP
jgi:hypothetical protein